MTATTEKVKCDACGTEVKAGRGLWAHKQFHCKGAAQAGAAAQVCQHKWRLLNGSDPRQAAAIRKGYKKFCAECEEVI